MHSACADAHLVHANIYVCMRGCVCVAAFTAAVENAAVDYAVQAAVELLLLLLSMLLLSLLSMLLLMLLSSCC